MEHNHLVSKMVHMYTVGALCYALYYGPKHNKQPRWVPAVVTKVFGTRSVMFASFQVDLPGVSTSTNYVLATGWKKMPIQEKHQSFLWSTPSQGHLCRWTGNVLDSGYTEAKDSPAEKPARPKHRNP